MADASKILAVSHGLIESAKHVTARGIPELRAAVSAGELTVSAAALIAQLAPDEQLEAISLGGHLKTGQRSTSQNRP